MTNVGIIHKIVIIEVRMNKIEDRIAHFEEGIDKLKCSINHFRAIIFI